MKKLFALLVAVLFVFTLSACGREEFEIAMITDAGDIDDESFNQGTWEGIVAYAEENEISHKYYKPSAVSDTAYVNAIDLAVSGGAKIVITPGFLFEKAVHEAQTKYPDVKFILIDGYPHAGDWTPDVADNTASVFFAEHESGFLAGYAAVKDGYTDLGFMGGMAVPAVVKFGIGYIAGAYYAAKEEGVTLSFPDNRYTYLGDFEAKAEHKNAAAAWYNAGTEIIFAAAGGAGSSVMSAASEANAMMIGVDVDQSGNSDTVLTSAMKELGIAVQQLLAAYYADEFPGGEILTKDVTEDGVGLPMETSRFTSFSAAQYLAIYTAIENGSVVVPSTYEELTAFFAEKQLSTLMIQQDTITPPSEE